MITGFKVPMRRPKKWTRPLGRFRRPSVILLRRMKPGDSQAKLDRLTYVLEAYANRLNHFLVVTPTNVRVKKTPIRKAA